MKIRQGFVSNSSSSSFLVVFKEPVETLEAFKRVFDTEDFYKFFMYYLEDEQDYMDRQDYEDYRTLTENDYAVMLYDLYKHNAYYAESFSSICKHFSDADRLANALAFTSPHYYNVATKNKRKPNPQLMYLCVSDCEPLEHVGELTPMELRFSKMLHSQPDTFWDAFLSNVFHYEEDHH